MSDLESGKVHPNLLKKFIKLSHNPNEYTSQSCQAAKIGKPLMLEKVNPLNSLCVRVPEECWL
jgi:hypothetical protein